MQTPAKFLGYVRAWKQDDQWRWCEVGAWAPENAELAELARTHSNTEQKLMTEAQVTLDFDKYTARFKAKAQNADVLVLDRIGVNVTRSAVLDCFMRRNPQYSRFRQILLYGEDFKMFADAWEQELKLQR